MNTEMSEISWAISEPVRITLIRADPDGPRATYLVERLAIPFGFQPETNHVAMLLEFDEAADVKVNGQNIQITSDDYLLRFCEMADEGLVGAGRDYPEPGTSWTANAG